MVDPKAPDISPMLDKPQEIVQELKRKIIG